MDESRFRRLVAGVAILAGLVVLVTSHELFPYLSSNHDEGVYLQGAAMLLRGKLWLTSPVADQLQPWFFVHDGVRLYPRYSPVVAALFAPGVAVGWPRLVLAVVAAGNVALVGLLTRAAFDRPTGVLASGLALATPFFAFISATFLPYAPTTLLNLLFALGYVHAVRTGRLGWAGIAGVAVGLAAFARPYTALLFALPFVVHALWVLSRDGRDRGLRALRTGRSQALLVVGTLGLAGVGLTLAYNQVMTGDALRFPFQVFAPDDTVGFGTRSVGSYTREYTPALALRVTARVLWELATRWTVAAPLGVLVALVGLVPVARSVRRCRSTGTLTRPVLQVLVVAVACSVVVGNVLFWGPLNTLATLSDPTDGFMAQFGPFYHFDLLWPLAALGAAGTRWLVGHADRLTARFTARQRRVLVVVGLLVAVPVVLGAQAAALGPPARENAAVTDYHAQVAEPMAEQSFDDALVFVPTPYGPWLNHPFQFLRNGGGFDGPVVYAQDRGPASDFAVLDAFPGRTPHRLTYRGEWTGDTTDSVLPHVQPLAVREGPQRLSTTVGAVGTPSVVRLEVDGTARTLRVEGTPERGTPYRVTWALDERRVRLVSVDGSPADIALPLAGHERVTLAVTFVDVEGNPVTYRQTLSVDATGDRLRVLWPGERRVCLLTPVCGREGQVVPGGEYIDGVSFETHATAVGGEDGSARVAPSGAPDTRQPAQPRDTLVGSGMRRE